MVFYLSERPMMDRHTAVSLPYNTETIDSPMEGVIRVNLFHFAGGTGKKPSFDRKFRKIVCPRNMMKKRKCSRSARVTL